MHSIDVIFMATFVVPSKAALTLEQPAPKLPTLSLGSASPRRLSVLSRPVGRSLPVFHNAYRSRDDLSRGRPLLQTLPSPIDRRNPAAVATLQKRNSVLTQASPSDFLEPIQTTLRGWYDFWQIDSFLFDIWGTSGPPLLHPESWDKGLWSTFVSVFIFGFLPWPAIWTYTAYKKVKRSYDNMPKTSITLYKVDGDKCGESTLPAIPGLSGDLDAFQATLAATGFALGDCLEKGYTIPDGYEMSTLPIIGDLQTRFYRRTPGAGVASQNLLAGSVSSTQAFPWGNVVSFFAAALLGLFIVGAMYTRRRVSCAREKPLLAAYTH